MAEDDKKTSADEAVESPPESARKRGILPLVFVVVGAVLGGAAVVFLTPPAETRAQEPEAPAKKSYVYPETMTFTFNPLVERGQKQAKIAFRFVYLADPREVEPAAEEGGEAAGDGQFGPVVHAIQANWYRAYSRCLEVLSAQKARSHLSPRGKKRIKAILVHELSATLFPEHNATVQDVLWEDYFVQ